MTSFLSKVGIRELLSINNKRYSLDNAVNQHRSVMALFPDGLGDSPREAGKILYRYEDAPNEAFIIVRSAIAPSEEHNIKKIEEDFTYFEKGSIVKFRTSLSPVKRVRQKESFYTGEDDLEEWFNNKASDFFEDTNILNIEEKTVYRTSKRSNKNFIKIAQFDGFATVKDSDLLNEALINGIGRNKNYGCGLLTLVRVG